MSGRVYLPATLALLADWYAAGEVPADADRLVAPGEDEDSEYAALMGAADASRELLDGAGRRVVVVAEVADPRADVVVRWREVVAVHADDTERGPDADPDDDLAWYATQEVPHLLG
jgi:hypothetical protein